MITFLEVAGLIAGMFAALLITSAGVMLAWAGLSSLMSLADAELPAQPRETRAEDRS